MSAMAPQITSLTIVYLMAYSGADQRKHQSSASLAFARGIHRWPVNSPLKGPVTRKMFPFDGVIMISSEIKLLHQIVFPMSGVTYLSTFEQLLQTTLQYLYIKSA